MPLTKLINKLHFENADGAFLHGAMIPYFMASDLPRFIKNFKNNNYPEEVFRSGKFGEYNQIHPGPADRFVARTLGFGLSLYGTALLVNLTDVSWGQVGAACLATNVLSLAYSDIPAVKKTAKKARDLILNAGYELSRYCL